MTYTNKNKSFLFLVVLFGVLCSSYTIVNTSSSTNSNIDFEIQVLDELIIDSISDNSNDSLLVEGKKIRDEDSPLMFVKNQPHYEQCAHLETNLERDQCTRALINQFISENFIINESQKKKRTKGTILVQFVVSKTGEIINVKIIKSLSIHYDNEAVRVVRALPNMIPGKNLDKNVSILYHLPIRINIE